MSSQTVSSAGMTVPGEHAKRREARAGMAMSLATFAMAATAGIQALLYLRSFGTTGRTDGFFVAFALYTTFGVFSQSLRLTSVPLLVEPARLTVRQFSLVLVLLAVPILVATGALSRQLAALLAPGLASSDRLVTQHALPVLGAATVLQMWAAGAATILAIRSEFTMVARAYIAGALAGLVAYLALMETTRELTLGWSMLTMAVVTTLWMFYGIRASGGLGVRAERVLRARDHLRNVGIVLGRTSIYLSFNLLFVVTLAFASKASKGDTTVLSYAYLFTSYLVAGTGMALGMSRIPDMTREARADRRATVAATVPGGFRYAMLLVAPALAVLVVVGAPLVHELLPGSLDAAGVDTLRTFGLLLVPWTVFALLVNVLLPFMFALERARLVNFLALPLLVVHVLAASLGTAAFGIDGTVAAFAVAPALFTVVLVVAGAGPGARMLASELVRDASRFLAVAAVAFAAAAAVQHAVANGITGTFAGAIVGCCAYCGIVAVVARHQVRVLLGSLLAER